jgi:hypothetical protein
VAACADAATQAAKSAAHALDLIRNPIREQTRLRAAGRTAKLGRWRAWGVI